MLSIIRTRRADEDLIEIWRFIAADNPEAADRVLDAIERRWQQLALHPFSGVARDDILPGLRHLVAGRYLTLYRVTEAGIEILRVLQGQRRLDRSLIEDRKEPT
ncbi:type II toxin-antitoxin system RelE/ParE family toxin [Zavarzinia compransoris]|uniref:type II toxin-antitoxin system RelE/ParE family toxin n=1 Tax=Zavarzinia marina TaxID=2911065 RepID=UPI001F17AF63|nr:type II toxin-antitoxin system RelE/ParE family toxin [Zavarzinia marina]MCF4165619.1 type II toxin-antitoxin system RelE/ParE family toxin [Zavarzinia marina]